MEHMPAGLRVKGKAVVRSIDKTSAFVLRYGLVLVVFWIGCLKFTAYESKGVFNHASHSPLLAWAYHILDVRNFSRGIGVVEIATALLIGAGPVWPKLSILGSLAGIGMSPRSPRLRASFWSRMLCVGGGYLDPNRFSEIRR